MIIGAQKKDNGIYDAFNNGMKLAKGDYLGFLNSDDIYTENALEILNLYINLILLKIFFGAPNENNIGEFYMGINPIKFIELGILFKSFNWFFIKK